MNINYYFCGFRCCSILVAFHVTFRFVRWNQNEKLPPKLIQKVLWITISSRGSSFEQNNSLNPPPAAATATAADLHFATLQLATLQLKFLQKQGQQQGFENRNYLLRLFFVFVLFIFFVSHPRFQGGKKRVRKKKGYGSTFGEKLSDGHPRVARAVSRSYFLLQKSSRTLFFSYPFFSTWDYRNRFYNRPSPSNIGVVFSRLFCMFQ